MAKKEKVEKVSKNPKHWEGAEVEHSLKVGQKVSVQQFGVTTGGWEVLALKRHPDWELACYALRAPDGTEWPYIGKWYNKNMFAQIVAW
jgi:hypothetical protein